MRKQEGFTLVEIAVVLVIIGLLIGGVLKSQEMIANAKARSVINNFGAISTAANAYIDTYQALPGDDGNLSELNKRGGVWEGVKGAGDRDSRIGTLDMFNNSAANTENAYFFSHLRAAGLLSGNPATGDLPVNPFGGLIGVGSGGAFGISGNAQICMQNVPGKIAASVDRQLDDGVANTGIMRALEGAAPTPAPTAAQPSTAGAVYNESAAYTLCKSLQ